MFFIEKKNKECYIFFRIGDKMKKDGFTIVEILGVIVVLAVIMALVIPNLTSTSSTAKQKLYETKINMIEKAAILYAQDNYKDLIKDETTTIINKVINSDILLDSGYYAADNDDAANPMIVDPRTNGELNVDIQLQIDTQTKTITAHLKK